MLMEITSEENNRVKRKIRTDVERWECSVCTYMNPAESYKCEICFMRKGTSTRKPRLNSQVLEQQQLIAQSILHEKDDDIKRKKDNKIHPRHSTSSSLLKRWDRSSPLLFEVFANGYSVVISEFQMKCKSRPTRALDSPAPSTCSSLQGSNTFRGTSDQLSPTDSANASDGDPRLSGFPAFSESDYGDSLDSKPRYPPKAPSSTHSSATPANSRVTYPGAYYDPVAPPPSHSSTSSSLGAHTLSHPNSPHHPSGNGLFEVKCEHVLVHSEEAAHGGGGGAQCDDETDLPTDPATLCTSSLPSGGHEPPGESSLTDVPSPAVPKPELEDAQSRTCSVQSCDDQASAVLSRRGKKQRKHSLRRGRKSITNAPPTKRRRKVSGTPSNSSGHYLIRRSDVLHSAEGSSGSPCRPLRISISRTKKKAKRDAPKSPVIGMKRSRSETSLKDTMGCTPKRAGLKCKIRVVRSSVSADSDANISSTDGETIASSTPNTTRSVSLTSTLTIRTKKTKNEHSSFYDSALPQSKPPGRLSTDSRNTSAMTDSSGAAVLEMSH